MEQFKILDIKNLGEICRRLRKEKGLRQADLAKRAGVGIRFLSELERGKPTLEIGKVFQVIDYMGMDLMIRYSKNHSLGYSENLDSHHAASPNITVQ